MRKLKMMLVIWVWAVGAAASAAAGVDATFPAAIGIGGGYLRETAVQADGKIIVGGFFAVVNGRTRLALIRLNADGTPDATFNPPAFARFRTLGSAGYPTIAGIVVQSDGKIIVGGNFSVDGESRGLVRLNADGSPDAAYNAADGVRDIATVNDLLLPTDGKLLIAGSKPVDNPPNTSQSFIRRLTTTGSIEASNLLVIENLTQMPDGKIIGLNGTIPLRLNQNLSYDSTFPNYNGGYYDVAAQADGKFLLVGRFTNINNFNLLRAARINADSTIDTTFNVSNRFDPNNEVNRVVVQPDGRILIGGAFTALNGTVANRVARINADGTVDTTFNASSALVNSSLSGVVDLDWQANGKIVVTFQNGVLQLNADGSSDNTYQPLTFNRPGTAYAMRVQADDKIVIGGEFGFANSRNVIYLARFNADGTPDSGFSQNAVITTSTAIAIQSNGKIISNGGNSNGRVVRLNADGSTDRIFPVTGETRAVAAEPDEDVLAGGAGFLNRYYSTGTRDPAFNFSVGTSETIYALLVMPDGKILVGANGSDSARRVFRLNADGSLDTTFNTGGGVNGTVFSVARQANGKIIIGGAFTGVNFDTTKKYLARLNADGSLDATFTPSISVLVRDIKIQTDGKIIIGGEDAINRVAPVAGKIARLNQDGTLDATFINAAAVDAVVAAVDTQSGNTPIIAGGFVNVNGTAAVGIARLTNSGAAARFDFDGDGKADLAVFRTTSGTWYLQQSANGFKGVQFGQNGDKIVPADYDGDGKADVAVYRAGVWYLQRSQLGFAALNFGTTEDVPVPADYDGDGKADLAVFRPSDGTWYLNRSGQGFTGVRFGQAGDKPVAADYDGDGKADLAVYRAGVWYLQRSQLGFAALNFGTAEDKPTPADYDGDGKTDLAVFRPSNGTWYLQQSANGFKGVQFGQNGDLPTAADYDGDGKADVAVYRAGIWYLNRSAQGFTGISFGTAGDQPIASAFVP